MGDRQNGLHAAFTWAALMLPIPLSLDCLTLPLRAEEKPSRSRTTTTPSDVERTERVLERLLDKGLISRDRAQELRDIADPKTRLFTVQELARSISHANRPVIARQAEERSTENTGATEATKSPKPVFDVEKYAADIKLKNIIDAYPEVKEQALEIARIKDLDERVEKLQKLHLYCYQNETFNEELQIAINYRLISKDVFDLIMSTASLNDRMDRLSSLKIGDKLFAAKHIESCKNALIRFKKLTPVELNELNKLPLEVQYEKVMKLRYE